MKILVIGESCKDIYVYGKVERLEPSAPVPVFNQTKIIENPGMAYNTFLNIRSLAPDVSLKTNVNWDEISKTRYVEEKSNHMFIRVDKGEGTYGRCDVKEIELSHYEAIVISDYNKGFLTKEDIKYILDNHPLTLLDTKKEIAKWCENATFVKINNYELNKAKNITSKLKEKLVVTLGPAGASHKNTIYPVSSVEVRDLSGAGDSFLAGLSVKFLETKDIERAIVFANECATKVVQKRGTSVI